MEGEYSDWTVKDWDNFFITETGPKMVQNEELPIEGYGFWVFGNKLLYLLCYFIVTK
jgi:hypothetical protein